MNKPAAKEPSMDEILSSIRQIIADDDKPDGKAEETAAAPEPAAPAAEDDAVEEDVAAIDEMSFDLPESDEAEDDDALTLSSEQIVADDLDEAVEIGQSEVVDLEDTPGIDEDEELTPVVADDIAFNEIVEPEPEPQPAPDPVSVSDAAPMPDEKLSSDIADELLQPATEAAVKSAFSKLGTMAIGADGLTIEAMLREMLKPMLKEWLDENLPATVERLVEKEIERLSRGR